MSKWDIINCFMFRTVQVRSQEGSGELVDPSPSCPCFAPFSFDALKFCKVTMEKLRSITLRSLLFYWQMTNWCTKCMEMYCTVLD